MSDKNDYTWLVQKFRPSDALVDGKYVPSGLEEEGFFYSKDVAEALAREWRSQKFISVLWKVEWLQDKNGDPVRNRVRHETFLPWRDFS